MSDPLFPDAALHARIRELEAERDELKALVVQVHELAIDLDAASSVAEEGPNLALAGAFHAAAERLHAIIGSYATRTAAAGKDIGP